MKKLAVILLILLSKVSYSQFFNNHPYSSAGTIENPKGAFHPDLGFILPFGDTTLNPASSYNGAILQRAMDSRPYYSDGNKWIPFQVGATPSLIALSPLVYNSGTGTLSADTSILATQSDLLTNPKWELLGNIGLSSSNFLGTLDNAFLRFRTNNLERMIIDSSGNVSVGITPSNPAFKLDVNGTARFGSLPSGASIYTDLSDVSLGNIKMYFYNSSLVKSFTETFRSNFGFGNFGFSSDVQTSNNGLAIGVLANHMVIANNLLNNDYRNIGTEMFYSRGTDNLSATKHVRLQNNSETDIFDIYNDGTTVIGAGSSLTSSILTLNSTSKGFLAPRMSGGQMNAISSPATGLMVFNTDSVAYCYYSGAAWLKFGAGGTGGGTAGVSSVSAGYGTIFPTITGTGSVIIDTSATANGLSNKYLRLVDVQFDWHLTGNSGTDTAINFIGTKDAHALIFKANNFRSGIIDINGSENTAFGYKTLQVSGGASSKNSAFGIFALQNNTTGTNNSAFGGYALITNTTGAQNMALGTSSLFNNITGSGNAAIGVNSLFYNTSGSNNVAIGVNAGLRNNGTNNVMIGNGAMLNYNVSNSGNIGHTIFWKNDNGGDSTAGTTNLLAIGNISPISMFNVGTANQFQASSTGDLIKIKNVVYSWPSSEGVANGVLKNNGSGTLTWDLVDTLNLAAGYHTQNYYNTLFAPLSSFIGTNWVQEGNTITPGVSFLGTNNNASLRFRTNGVEHMRLDSLGANLYIGNTTTAGLFPINDISQLGVYSSMTGNSGAYLLMNSATPSAFTDSGSAMITIGNYNGVSPLNPLFRIRSANNNVIKDHFIINNSGQAVISDGPFGVTPTPTAMLDIRSTTKGVKFPTLNTIQMNAIISPALGLMLFNNDSASIVIWNGAKWAKLGGGSGGGGGSGTVISVGSGYGLLGGPITSTGTLLVDTSGNGLSTKLWRQKGVDSLNALIALRQLALSGTGFVKISGTTISYDNSTYLTSATVSGKLDSVKRSGTSNIIQQWKNAGTATTAFIDQGLVDSVINISTTVQRTYYTSGTTLDNTFAVDSIFFTGDVIGSGLLNIPLTVTTTPSLSIYADLGGDIVAEGMTNISQLKAQTTFSAGVRITILRVPSSRVITGIEFLLNTPGVYTATAYNGFGLYSYDNTSGLCTLVASSTNNPTLWSNGAVVGTVHQAFSAPYTAAKGTYYLMSSYNNTNAGAETQKPIIASGDPWQNSNVAKLGNFPNGAKIAASTTAITSLPSSFNIATYGAATSDYYFAGYQ